MILLTVAATYESPPYAVHGDVGELFVDMAGEVRSEELEFAAPSLPEAREVEARINAIAAKVRRTARHLQEHLEAASVGLPPEAEIDAALRMPRGEVVHRKGTLRFVERPTAVASPTAEELAHLFVGDQGDAG